MGELELGNLMVSMGKSFFIFLKGGALNMDSNLDKYVCLLPKGLKCIRNLIPLLRKNTISRTGVRWLHRDDTNLQIHQLT